MNVYYIIQLISSFNDYLTIILKIIVYDNINRSILILNKTYLLSVSHPHFILLDEIYYLYLNEKYS